LDTIMHDVKLICFFSSYLVALALEATQLLRKLRINRWAAVAFTAAGLVAHTAYLIARSRDADLPPLLSSTHDWLLVLSWLAVVLYLFVELCRPQLSLGLFVLPLVLVLVGVTRFVSTQPNPNLGPLRGLGMLHASLLVVGTAGVFVAFVASLMYLVQHRRLKQKQAEPEGLHLLSLETLSRANWWSVVVSVPLLTLGMASGVWLSLRSQSTDLPIDLGRGEFVVLAVLWSAMVALFVWLVATRKAAGRLVAWRTVWACGFLLLTMLLLQLFSSGGIHGTG
jgi:ABC-type uncharacterized transport system permease subunit